MKRKIKKLHPTEILSTSSSILVFYLEVPLGIFAERWALAIPFWILGKLLDFIPFSLSILFYIIAISGF